MLMLSFMISAIQSSLLEFNVNIGMCLLTSGIPLAMLVWRYLFCTIFVKVMWLLEQIAYALVDSTHESLYVSVVFITAGVSAQ